MYHRRMKKVLEKLKNEEFKKKVLLKESAFSRKQNMPFEDMVKFMIRDNKKSTSNELIDYFKLTNNIENTITKQAFSFQRQNISYEVFNLLNEEFIKDFYTEENYKTYHGYVVIGTDGTNIEIPNNPKLKEIFGTAKGNKLMKNPPAKASASGFYDCLNNIMLLSEIYKYNQDEKFFLINQIDKLIDLMDDKKLLLVFDRGYVCTELLILLSLKGVKYVFRCPNNTFNEMKTVKTKDEIIEIAVTKSKTSKFKTLNKKEYIDTKIKTRLVSIELETEEIEYLMTNLDVEEIQYSEMKDLYFKRWNIEKSFEILKNKLQIENIGARTENGVKQEFYACILLYNFLEDIKNQMNNDISNNKNNKYQYKINMNILVGTLKKNLIEIINSDLENLDDEIEKLYNQIKRNLIVVKPNRKNPRNKTRTANKHRINHRSSF